ncbi:surface lipoprotein assembly modifier [Citrobacter braakii]|uniref:surface lipoprotein assembly modifier n=1 Tax=Citrobacter braakii TaxID=57706 RepID=UPI00351D8BA6
MYGIIFYLAVILLTSLSLFGSAPSAAKNLLPEAGLFSPDQLSVYPDLVFKGLSQAVIRGDSKMVDLLLPLYQQQLHQDQVLITWARAVQEKSKGNYSRAVFFYRKVITTHPQFELARLQLAITLFQNHDNDSALSQFRKLQSSDNNPELRPLIERYIIAIQKNERVSFTAGLSYLNDSNINNVSSANKHIGPWRPVKRESAQGFSYFLSARKSWSLPDNLFTESRGMLSGKYFTNNHQYDELTGRFSSGIGYRNIDFSILALPFVEYNWLSWSDGPSLSLAATQPGLRLESEYRLTNHWKVSSVAEVSHTDYRKWKQRNSQNYLLDETLFYFQNSQQYWFYGVMYNREEAQVKRYSFSRNTLYAGWGREWENGLSTLFQPSYSYKRYDEKDFFHILQQHHQYSLLASIWHRDIYFAGITPKINIQYLRNDSNNPFYQYDKMNFFLTLSRSF